MFTFRPRLLPVVWTLPTHSCHQPFPHISASGVIAVAGEGKETMSASPSEGEKNPWCYQCEQDGGDDISPENTSDCHWLASLAPPWWTQGGTMFSTSRRQKNLLVTLIPSQLWHKFSVGGNVGGASRLFVVFIYVFIWGSTDWPNWD